MQRETSRNLLRDPIAALRGARNPHVRESTLRFLRSVRLALGPLTTVSTGFQRVIALILCLCCIDANAAAQPIDASRSSAEIGVRLRWIKTVHCAVRQFEGEVLPFDDSQQRVSIRFDVRSLDFEGNEHFASHARSEEFFDVERYPWVVFESAPFAQALLYEGGDLRGDLFLRGVFRPVTFTVHPTRCDRPGLDCAIEVSGKVSRTAFGMTTRRFMVKDKVRIDFSMLLEQRAAAESAGK